MTGDVCAPKGTEEKVRIDAHKAERLALYKRWYLPGVLAPRGWQCSGSSGSMLARLVVSPVQPQLGEPLQFGVDMTFYNGDTSAWMAVTEMSALVFPAKRTLVREKIAEGWFENGLRFSPYPKDRLAYKNATTVYYTTPPHSEGLGTRWGPFKPSEHPIRGLAMLAEVTRPSSLVFLAVRLPPEMADLTSTIIEEIRTYYVTKERKVRQLLRQAGAPP